MVPSAIVCHLSDFQKEETTLQSALLETVHINTQVISKIEVSGVNAGVDE